MRRLIIAFQVFWKALTHPDLAEQFLKNLLPSAPTLAADPSDFSHLRLLSLLQQSGRLIDFIKEDLSSFSDAQVGAAVRKIHADSGKVLEELVTIRPYLEEKEGSTIRVPMGYDPSTIKIVGKVKGEPPFTGVLIHKGWKAHKRSLPKKIGEQSVDVICPAEVEIQ